MPIYHFKCSSCGTIIKKLLPVEKFEKLRFCDVGTCAGVAEHTPGASTAQAMEVLDDGIRPVKIERLADAERIFQERAEKHKQTYEQTDDQQEE